MNICVTGAGGFVGQNLVKALVKRKHHVTALTRRSDRDFPAEVRVVIGDLTDDNFEVDSFLFGCDLVYHCAGELNNNESMTALHIGGTQRLVSFVSNQNGKRKQPIHWVQLSSVGVYGPSQECASEERLIIEDSIPSPKGVYEATKLAADKIVMDAATNGGLTYSIVRPSNIFGANMPNKTLGNLINAVHKSFFFYIGRKGAVAPYVHVDDIINVLLLCSAKKEAKNEIFNVSNDIFLEEMITGIALYFNVNKPWFRIPESLVRCAVTIFSRFMKLPLTHSGIDFLVSRTQYSSEKLQKKLGVKASITVVERLDEIISSKNR